MEEFYLRFPAEIKYLELAATMCRELCQLVHKRKVSKDFVRDIELCITEACTNAIKHGSQNKTDDFISVRFRVYPDKVVIRIGDRGEGFDLKEIPAPNLEIHPERGYGLYIIRSKMDKVRYTRTKKGNYFEMTKYFAKSTKKGSSR